MTQSLPLPSDLRMRVAQKIDRAFLAEMRAGGAQAWELPEDPPTDVVTTVFESQSRIVAASSAYLARFEPPELRADPLPEIAAPSLVTGDRAVIGAGLWVCDDLDPGRARFVHRLCRTLAAQQEAARFCLTRVPLPEVPGFDPAGVVQQITAGAVDWPPLSVALTDGYWPIGIAAGQRAVWTVWRNEVI